MIIDINKIKRRGGGPESFFFSYEPQDKIVTDFGVSVENPIKVNGKVILTGEHSAVIEMEICFLLKGNCTNCLKETEKEFVLSVSETAGEEDGYPVINDKIDLSEIVDETLLLNMPTKFLCKEDCKGICIGCGANLNEEPCKCQK